MDEMITDTSLTVEDDLSEEQEEIEGVTEENAEATEESEPDIGEMLGEELSQLKETFPSLRVSVISLRLRTPYDMRHFVISGFHPARLILRQEDPFARVITALISLHPHPR